MNQNIRYCSLLGHEEYPVFHICTIIECSLATRWCCPECIQQGIHIHSQPNNQHVMNRKGISAKLTNEYETFKKNFSDNQMISSYSFLENILNECQSLERNLIDFMKYIEKQIQNLTSDEDQARFEQYLRYLNEYNFSQLDDDKINQLLNISQKSNKNIKQLLQQPLDTIVKQINQIEQIIKDYHENKSNDSNSIIDFKNRKYTSQEIDQSDNYYCSSISKNERYLAYGGYNKVLRIYDINLRKIIKEIKLDNYLQACQFTQDSSQLYVGLVGGFVFGFNIQDDFKQIYKHQIHSNDVNNILTIQNQYLITCSFDQTIIKTEIKSNQQIFKLNGHTDNIIAIDYSDKDEVIISGSDRSIKLWNCKDQSIIISKNQAHNNYIRQIQLIYNNLNILSLDKDGNLFKWKIDLIQKDLIKLEQFIDQNKIFNFQQINQNQNLLLICNNYAKILNQKGETLNIVQHGGQSINQILLIDNYICDCRQLDNLNYIQIRTLDKMILVIAQD